MGGWVHRWLSVRLPPRTLLRDGCCAKGGGEGWQRGGPVQGLMLCVLSANRLLLSDAGIPRGGYSEDCPEADGDEVIGQGRQSAPPTVRESPHTKSSWRGRCRGGSCLWTHGCQYFRALLENPMYICGSRLCKFIE